MKKIIITSAVVSAALLVIVSQFSLFSLLNISFLKTSILETEKSTSKITSIPFSSFSLTPISDNDKNPISSFTFSGDPGDTITGKLLITNLNNLIVAGDLYPAMSVQNSTSFVARSKNKPGPEAAWIKIAEKESFKPMQTKTIPFTITIPKNAAPGMHILGIVADSSPEKTGKKVNGGLMDVTLSAGMRITLKVTGKEIISAKIGELSIKNSIPYNIFSITAENDGNTIIKPRITTEVTSKFGTINNEVKPAPVSFELFPGATTTLDIHWPYTKIGKYDLTFTIEYNGKKEVREISVIIYPSTGVMIGLLSIFLLILILVIYFIFRKKSNQLGMSLPEQVVIPPPVV